MVASLDKVTWVSTVYAAPSTAAQNDALACHPVESGFTRYWWRFYTGTNTGQLPLVFGQNFVHGHLTDTPAEAYVRWRVDMPLE